MIEVTLTQVQPINIELSESTEYQVGLGSELVISKDYEEYTGSYTVTPSSVTQILSTAGKYTGQDIKVNEIPYAEVSNASGGNTATIG